jgi:hypothetical protein
LVAADNGGMTSSPATPPDFTLAQLWRPIAAMVAVIVLSNWLVQFPVGDWLTWGAFTYPVVYLVNDLTNRAVGAVAARKVAWAGFAVAVLVSAVVAPPRIAVASGTAFIVSQFLDIAVFNRWRQSSWWKAPFFGSAAASVIDTLVFFFLAFAGTQIDWRTLAAGDLLVKVAMAAALLAPYRAMLPRLRVWVPSLSGTR